MRWNVQLALTSAWTAAGTAFYLIVPDSAPFLLPLTLVAPLLFYPGERLAAIAGRSLLARFLAVAASYLIINATWSTSPTLAYIGVATFVVASVVVHVVGVTLPFIRRELLRAMALGFYAGYVVSASLLCIEVLLGHPIFLRVFSSFPAVAPQIITMASELGSAKSLPSHFLNKNIAALTFLIWPALLVGNNLASSSRSRTVLVICLAPAITAAFASSHETSKIAIVGGIAVLFTQMLAPRQGKTLLSAAWIFACLAVVPLAAIAYNLKLHQATWLQPSAQHRVVIWGVTSAKTANAPLLGHGMVAAREIGRRDNENPKYASGSTFSESTGPHAHNVYLQVWFDTGLVGVALMLGIGLFALRAIALEAATNQPSLYAAFASNTLLAASSFSIWARWFLASFALSTIFAVLASKFATNMREA